MIKLFSIKEATHIKDLPSPLILELQTILERLGHDVGEIDGIYGNNTLYAFNKFKEKHKLTNPGLIGPTTINYMVVALEDSLDYGEKENSICKKQPVFSDPQLVKTIDWTNFSCAISKYFTVGEVSKFNSDRIIYNPSHRQNAIKLANILDDIRIRWKGPIGVTSWYRPYKINRAVGGSSKSSHLTGSAADIYPINGNGLKFEKWLDSFYQGALGYGQIANKGFTHIDLRTVPRRIRWNY